MPGTCIAHRTILFACVLALGTACSEDSRISSPTTPAATSTPSASSTTPTATNSTSTSPEQAGDTGDNDSVPTSANRERQGPAALRVAWRNRRLTPVTGVEDVDGVAVLYAREGRRLTINGLDPATGEHLWSHEAGPGEMPSGISIFVGETGRHVTYLEPADGLSARVVLATARTGKVIQRSAVVRIVFMPDGCEGSDGHVCVTAIDDDQLRTLRMGTSSPTLSPPPRSSADAMPDGYFGIGARGLARTTGTEIRRIVRGRARWTVDLEELLGRGYTTDVGWSFRYHERNDSFVGSVARQPENDTFRLIDSVTFAVSAVDGRLLWRRQRVDSFEDIDVTKDGGGRREPLLAYEWTGGTIRFGREGPPTSRDLAMNVVRLNPLTGDVIWRARIGDVDPTREKAGLPGSPELSLADRTTLVLRAGEAHHQIDVITGAVSQPSWATMVWRAENPVFKYEHPLEYDGEKYHDRVGRDLYVPRTLGGAPVAEVLGPLPGDVATEFPEGIRIVASRDEVTAYRE